MSERASGFYWVDFGWGPVVAEWIAASDNKQPGPGWEPGPGGIVGFWQLPCDECAQSDGKSIRVLGARLEPPAGQP